MSQGNDDVEVKTKNLGGRPTLYTEELGQRICDIVAASPHGLNKICREYDWMPEPQTIYNWRAKDDRFFEMYRKARVKQAEVLSEFCLDVADDSSQDVKIGKDGQEVYNNEFVNRSRLKIETRKWLACKLIPQTYGTHIEVSASDTADAICRAKELANRIKNDSKI